MKLYLCDKSKINTALLYQEFLPRFDDKRQERILRFRQEKDRYSAVIRELMLGLALRETFPGMEVRLGENAHGKPVITDLLNQDGRSCDGESYAGFDFNISHSGDLVVIAFGERTGGPDPASVSFREGPMGVDVERLGRVRDYRRLLRFFYKEEQDMIAASKDPEREFYRVWTWREAFSKEEGIGLSLFEKEKASIDYDKKRITYRGRGLSFHEYDYPGYQITLCVQEGADAPDLVVIGEEIFYST